MHTVFNVITTLILVWFIPQLVKMVTWMVPDEAVNAATKSDFEQADKELIHYEDVTDNFEKEIATYLREISKHELSSHGMARVWEHKGRFTPQMLQQVNRMIDLLDDAYTAMDYNLATPLIEITDIRNAEQAEQAINDYRDVLRSQHLSNIEKASYPYETGSFHMDLINCMEKMGDFIINISQSVIEAKNV